MILGLAVVMATLLTALRMMVPAGIFSVALKPDIAGPYSFRELDDQSFGGDRICGIAFIIAERVKPADWGDKRYEKYTVQDFFREFEYMKSTRKHEYRGDSDFSTWKPPRLVGAWLRRTTPSCMLEDCDLD